MKTLKHQARKIVQGKNDIKLYYIDLYLLIYL